MDLHFLILSFLSLSAAFFVSENKHLEVRRLAWEVYRHPLWLGDLEARERLGKSMMRIVVNDQCGLVFAILQLSLLLAVTIGYAVDLRLRFGFYVFGCVSYVLLIVMCLTMRKTWIDFKKIKLETEKAWEDSNKLENL